METNDAAIAAAYHSIVQNQTNWILLHYDNENFDDLVFYADGANGLEELKTRIYDLDSVFVALYREETDFNPGYVLINYIPPCISGVKRARALVHSRRVGILFRKHQTMLTVDTLSQMTATTIHKALVDPDSFTALPMGHSFSQLPDYPTPPPKTHTISSNSKKPKPITLDVARRSFSETYAPHIPAPQFIPPVPPVPKAQKSMFGNLLRRMKEPDDTPPPTPPKDTGPSFNQSVPRRSPPRLVPLQKRDALPPPPYPKGYSLPGSLEVDFAVISHTDCEEDTVVIRPTNNRQNQTLVPLRGKWARQPVNLDPEERERIRLEKKRRQEEEERQALEDERRRQEEIKLRKEQAKRQEEREEIERRQQLKAELRRIAEEKEIRRREEQEREERKNREMEERRRFEREKRLEEHRKLEEWRRAQDKLREEEALKAAHDKKQEEAERLRKIQLAEKVVVKGQSENLFTGWITVQFPDSLFWKRRYFKFMNRGLYLYRSPKDMETPLESVGLVGELKGLKEWSDGYEDLEAIPFSFVIEFKGQRTWSAFADSEDDKFRVLGLLKHASGL